MTTKPYALIATLLLGCTSADDDSGIGQSGTDVLRDTCGVVESERRIAADEDIGGTTPAQLVALAQGIYTFRERWVSWPADTDRLTSREVAGELEVTADVAGAAEQRFKTDDPGRTCPLTIGIPAVITLRTDDGTLAGEFPGTLQTGKSSRGLPAFVIHGLRPREELTGSYDASGYAQRVDVSILLQGERYNSEHSKLTQAWILAVERDAPPGTPTMSIALWN